MNAQAGYESMLTCMACQESGINIMTQSAGILDSYLAVSYEKLVVDFEIQAFVKRYLRDIEVNEETIPMDLICELGQDGQYLMEDHTLEFCRKEFCIPALSVRGPHEDANGQFQKNIEKRLQQLLNAYHKPAVSETVLESLQQLLLNEGIQLEDIEKAVMG